jgi:hypothetical protein
VLGRWGDSAKENDPWDEWMISDLELPFPLTESWNLPEEALVPPNLNDERLETWFERRDATYFAPALINGTIPIAHLGVRHLATTGGVRSSRRAGLDRRPGQRQRSGPASPAAFTEWYLAWLEESEAAVEA